MAAMITIDCRSQDSTPTESLKIGLSQKAEDVAQYTLVMSAGLGVQFEIKCHNASSLPPNPLTTM
jgi:hypothetical protein